MHFLFFAVSTLAVGVFAIPAPHSRPNQKHVIHEKRHSLPTNWRRNERLSPNSTLPMRIGLVQSNLDKAEDYLLDVSHPTSPNFGKHWTAKQVAETFAPSKDAVDAVTAWLAGAGVRKFSQSQSLNWISANVTVAKAEQLLRTTFFQYEHATGGMQIACEEYSVPENLTDHIDFITPTIHFDVELEQMKRSSTFVKLSAQDVQSDDDTTSELEQCDKFTTPDCLRALYGFPPEFPEADGNSFGIVEFGHQNFVQSDLNQFFAKYSPSLVGVSPAINFIDDAVMSTEKSSFQVNGESDLDLEYAMALVYPLNVSLFQVGDPATGGSFNNFLDALDESYCTYMGGDVKGVDSTYPDGIPGGYQGPENCGGLAATKVISISYVYNEADLSPAYVMRQCNEYLKLGLLGATVLFSSGDYGVKGNTGQCLTAASSVFNPSFPSTCPYVTSVGATQLNGKVTDPEVAASNAMTTGGGFYSGGGFSNVFPMPDYQKDAVASFYENYPPPYGADRYNNSMMTRGYPDISANGANYVTVVDGNFANVYGTSASAPVVGSILTMINSIRICEGKNSIGFINPTLYEHSWILNDIISGTNPGCGTSGFNAVPGWDPVTGLGTSDFRRMAHLWLFLP